MKKLNYLVLQKKESRRSKKSRLKLIYNKEQFQKKFSCRTDITFLDLEKKLNYFEWILFQAEVSKLHHTCPGKHFPIKNPKSYVNFSEFEQITCTRFVETAFWVSRGTFWTSKKVNLLTPI